MGVRERSGREEGTFVKFGSWLHCEILFVVSGALRGECWVGGHRGGRLQWRCSPLGLSSPTSVCLSIRAEAETDW